ncbi:hypothetical protein GUJ93_ZPchr0008g13989 [Zizania palustris]|uniref:Uncharacterized protein n=1 Tax=Zizania palustris TaxID=103762 RepID=A0A8J5RX95_ZIZPA|nr:hypothetical protein GUJ93_ZPchr0008g13989 [Zizania palustris]
MTPCPFCARHSALPDTNLPSPHCVSSSAARIHSTPSRAVPVVIAPPVLPYRCHREQGAPYSTPARPVCGIPHADEPREAVDLVDIFSHGYQDE